MKLTLTREMIFNGRTFRGGWTKAQLNLLGIQWPPVKGWLSRLIGTTIAEKDYNNFLEIGKTHGIFDKPLKFRKDYETPDLFQTIPSLNEKISDEISF